MVLGGFFERLARNRDRPLDSPLPLGHIVGMRTIPQIGSADLSTCRPRSDWLSAMALNQFRNKLKTHGLTRTLLYSLAFAVRPGWRKCWVNGLRQSFSQDYEDLIIDKLLGNKATGTYLDIGAFDPTDLSNTKRFYDRGWRGCNVEPDPVRFQKFLQARPDDINLNVGLSD